MGIHPGMRSNLRVLAICLGLSTAAACRATATVPLRPAALAMTRDEAMHENCCKEVAELHAFFEGWFLGTLPDSEDTFRRFSSVLAEEFEMVTPGGATRSREEILASVRGARGTAGGEGDPRLRVYTKAERASTVGDGLFLVTYEEWQAEGAVERGRISSVLMRAKADTPNGVEWVHLHETWLD